MRRKVRGVPCTCVEMEPFVLLAFFLSPSSKGFVASKLALLKKKIVFWESEEALSA